jgi:iron-sulfur cluster repair protein YtfE (RIC family)
MCGGGRVGDHAGMTKLSDTASHQRTTGPDTHDMVVIHRIFRRGFPELAALVHAVPPGDTARAGAVAPQLEFLLNGLHHHHTAEDTTIWPRLLERAPEAAHEVIARMPSDHDAVDVQVTRIRDLLPGWRANPTPRELATAIDELDRLLVAHLDVEEREILPLVEVHLTEAEWQQAGEDAFADFTNDEKLVATGQMIDVASPEEAAMFMGRLPTPIRVMWKLLGHRKYRRYIAGVRGGA